MSLPSGCGLRWEMITASLSARLVSGYRMAHLARFKQAGPILLASTSSIR